jgi:DNA repair protein RAD16
MLLGVLLLRLRQAVDHPYLVVHSSTAPPADAGMAAADAGFAGSGAGGDEDNERLMGFAPPADEDGHSDMAAMRVAAGDAGCSSGAGTFQSCTDDGSCSLCHDPREDGVTAACGHAFCRSCVAEYVDSVTRVSSKRGHRGQL